MKLGVEYLSASMVDDDVWQLQVPFHMYCSVREDLYRKPRLGVWERIMQHYPLATCSMTCFVGDAAGRKTDWSSSDR